MEFKLNKIDPDLRRQVNDAAKAGKVHGANHNLSVNKDKNDESSKQNFDKNQENNERILIKAEKKQDIEIDVFSEKETTDTTRKGKFLDVRK